MSKSRLRSTSLVQVDLRELARVAPSGKRWTSLADLISYCFLQWPTIKARLEKKGGFAKPATEKTAGKRKMSPGRTWAKAILVTILGRTLGR
jgi:hypothetical protein